MYWNDDQIKKGYTDGELASKEGNRLQNFDLKLGVHRTQMFMIHNVFLETNFNIPASCGLYVPLLQINKASAWDIQRKQNATF
jgi:hypothetical protein